MPELPEVETVRAGLAPFLEGRVLARVVTRRPDLRFPFPDGFGQALTGQRITRLERRAKYLLAHCAAPDGAPGPVLLMHLGMSGRFTIIADGLAARPGQFVHAVPSSGPSRGPTGEGTHDHVVFETDAGVRVVYTDHRRFGFMLLCDAVALSAHPMLAALGPEPLSPAFTPESLQASLKGRRSPLKAGLLDQTVVAGLGNIYVCEALYRARLSPRRACHTVGTARATRLVAAIQAVLREAIDAGGSTLRDYAHADGSLGYFQHRFCVYDREGEICPDHGCGSVQRIVQSGRSTFFCPGCQR